MIFNAVLFFVAAIAGAVASVAGFGIGSLLTPLLALQAGAKLAVAVIAVPHFLGTALRFWMMRRHIDRRLLWNFGLTSAAFGLIGAVIHAYATSGQLSWIFGGLLILAGVSTLTGFMERLRPGRKAAWLAGALSGIFGGLVGNQGGIRTAALLGFRVSRDAFVATATAIALMVDLGRLPVYLVTGWSELWRQGPALAIASVGVLVGTITGARLLRRIPERIFHRVVAIIVIALGIYMLLK